MTISKCRQTKKMVLDEIEGYDKSQYERLYDYAEVSNLGSTMAVRVHKKEIDGKKDQFSKTYVCVLSL